jgi:phospholipase/carboxylesterase
MARPRIQVETLGALKCRIVDCLPEGTKPTLVAILCHGYGASGTDLVPIGYELLEQFPELQSGLQFVFPEAPRSLEDLGMPEGRAWWPIDMVKLQLANATGRFRDLRREAPPELENSRQKLLETLKQITQRTGLELDHIVLGGFSQGAMLTTDTSLFLGQNVAALIAMSGTLLNEPEWQERAPRHASLRVLQSHGTDDPILPFVAAEWLRDLLTSAGASVEFVSFPGGHTIPFEVLDRMASLLNSLMNPAP